MGEASAAAMDVDLEAVDRCLAGDQQAFGLLVERHKTVVYSLARRMVRNEAEAEDIAQEAFVRAYVSLRSFRRESSFRNWLCRIATRLCIDHLRSRRTEKELTVNEELLDSPRPGPEEEVVVQEQLRLALSRIPAHLRAAVVLRHLEELSYQEMAEILQLPLGTVKTHLRRGRAALKQELEKMRREEAQIYRGAGES